MNTDRARRACVATAAGLAVVLGPVAAFGPGAAVADPAGATQTVFDRSLHLQGVPNARDLGGYRTVSGKSVRTGLVYRTAQLNNATPADLAELSRRQVRVVDDLRTVYERMIAPDRIPAGATANWDDVIGHAPPAVLASALTGGEGLYRAFITAPQANESFAAVLRDIVNTEDGAVLFHCTAGKDRTGWAAAVLLTLLGVDHGTVTQDYLLSNQYRDAAPGDSLNGVQSQWLDAAFDQVTQSYGTFDNYVRDGLKLTAADVTALKAKLLV